MMFVVVVHDDVVDAVVAVVIVDDVVEDAVSAVVVDDVAVVVDVDDAVVVEQEQRRVCCCSQVFNFKICKRLKQFEHNSLFHSMTRQFVSTTTMTASPSFLRKS